MKIRKKILTLLIFTLLCVTAFGNENKNSSENSQYFGVYDPWEPLNRRIYYFNYTFDKYVFLPVVDAYNLITPTFVQKGVKNFFANSINLTTTGNSILQAKPKKSMKAWGRFSKCYFRVVWFV
mgnify:CR=1 FL=1